MWLSRTEQSRFAQWWWTVDRQLIAVVLLMAFVGVLLSLATSPSLAYRVNQDTFFLARKQIIFLIPSLLALFAISSLSITAIQRLAWALLVGGIVALIITLNWGVSFNGARRWISLGVITIQPAEFVKPAFILLSGVWIAKSQQENNFRGYLISFVLLVMLVGLLLRQPDVGQAFLISAAWVGLLFVSGISWRKILGIGGMFVVAVIAAYHQMSHVKSRLDAFFNPSISGGWQLEQAQKAFSSAGWLGKGPGEGVIKARLPDAHSDFVFAVAAEEFGILACLALVGCFAFVVVRGLQRADAELDNENRYPAIGLFILFGLQAITNIGVNLQILPPKGMTLPLVSAGGSSLLSSCIMIGFLLSLTRRRPGNGLLKRALLSDLVSGGGSKMNQPNWHV